MECPESGRKTCATRPMGTVVSEHNLAEIANAAELMDPRRSEAALAAIQVEPPERCPARGIRRVLVADNDDVIRRLIAANLALEGFDVTMAADGQDCLEMVPAVAPDVIIMNATMPRLDGWDTIARLRNCPDTSHIKIVLITARTQENGQRWQRRIGANAYLTRPFDAKEMIRVTRKLAGAPPLVGSLNCPLAWPSGFHRT
jgi:CheY-like chemotaxis protein